MKTKKDLLIEEISKNLRLSKKEAEKSLQKLIDLKLVEISEEELNENNKDNSK